MENIKDNLILKQFLIKISKRHLPENSSNLAASELFKKNQNNFILVKQGQMK